MSNLNTTVFPTIDEIRQASSAIAPWIVKTPLWQNSSDDIANRFSKETNLYFKLELFQRTGSFKARAAFYRMLQMSPEQKKQGVVAASAGNHAIATAYVARQLTIHAKVVMPKTASSARIERCKQLGADVELVEDIQRVFTRSQEIVEREKRFLIHPFEGEGVTLGTGTLGLEILEQLPETDVVIVPIGGGGLCGGIACAVKQHKPNCAVYGAEPIGADSMRCSREAGRIVALPSVHTIADSLAVTQTEPYSLAVNQRFVDQVVTVTDHELRDAMRLLFQEMKLAVEPAAACALAAALGPLKSIILNKRTVLVLSGTNTDSVTFCKHIGQP